MIIIVNDKSIFSEQFILLKKELNPIILQVIEENNIGDNPALFYFASLIKETVRKMNDKEIEESVIRFILDGE